MLIEARSIIEKRIDFNSPPVLKAGGLLLFGLGEWRLAPVRLASAALWLRAKRIWGLVSVSPGPSLRFALATGETMQWNGVSLLSA